MNKLFYSINFRLLMLISFAFTLTAISVLYLADRQFTTIIDASQTAVYTEKVEAVYELLQRSEHRLRKTGMVDAYLDDFQEASLKILHQDSYQRSGKDNLLFIIANDGRIVMHPTLDIDAVKLVSTELMPRFLATESGDFDCASKDGENWYLFKKFTPWNWIIVYQVPLKVKYQNARQFRKLMGIIMTGISLLVLLCLSVVVTRFTRPILRLSNIAQAMADGDLEQKVDFSGYDEVGILARSFDNMRASISQQILELEEENYKRQKAQDSLAAEKERLAVTLRSIGDGVITTDIHGKIIMLNKIAEELTGWSNSEAKGELLVKIFNIINEETGEKCENPVSKVIESGQIVGLANHTALIAKDGTERSIADSGAPIFNAQGKIVGVVLVFRDVSEQLRTEKELLKIKKIESIGVLAGGIAHDFNNILAAILGNIDLALLDEDLKDDTKKLLTAAEKASLRAKDLTGQLLTFSKGGDPVRETSSLAAVIMDSANFVLHGENVACHYTIPDDLWMVDIDKGQISQVIQNIVLNAGQSMVNGGSIDISCKNITAHHERTPFAMQGEFVKIFIKDTGPGISAATLEKIFDPYFSTKKKGSGLGLAISHSIITKHGGYIFAESRLGAGTSFTIYLPVSQNRKELQTEADKAVVKSVANAKILVMDDEEILRSVTKAMLSNLGYETTLSADGEEAVKLYEKAMEAVPFDLVIMDLTIPGGMGGKDAVQEILKLDPEARVIVASGYSNDPVMANYKDYGFCATIEKPYTLQKLSQVVSEII